MCGITGFYSTKGHSLDRSFALEKALDSIAHRGPDHRATFIDQNVHFGHSRLAIIDTTELGNQPMSDHSGKYYIIFNGICYNHLELRKKLQAKGIVFRSNSDTETVLYWLIENGAIGLDDLNGFFSLALYNKKDKKLLLARDRFGIKPLFYSISEEGLAFGSELRAVQPYLGKCHIDEIALQAYLHLNYIPSPHSMLREIKKLSPGTYVIANISGKIELHNYFNLEYGRSEFSDISEAQIEKKLDESVRKRLIADVPLGCFLSGGLDSSILTGLASRHKENLDTFTMVFRGEKQYDESEDAAMVAKHFNCNHHEVELTKNDLLETADKILNHSDEPFADSSSIAMHALSHKVRPQIKVALSGDGGDELFAGYYKHLALYYSFEHPFWCQALRLFSPIINLLPSSREEGLSNSLRKLQRFSTSAGLPPAPRYWNWAGYGNPLQPYKNNTLNADTFLSEIHEKKIETFDDCLKMDLRMVLEGDMLVKTDRMSMMNGLEVRVPFLDHNFVEMVSRIPSGIKIAKNDKKMLLKESFAHMLPEDILNKQKHGFEVPLKKYLQSDLSNHLNTFLDESLILDQGIFDIKSIRKGKRMLMRKNSGNAEYSLWNLMIFNSWYQRNKDMIEA